MSGVVNYVGAPIELTWTSSDTAAASLTVTQPDGTVLAPARVVTSDGAAHQATFTPTLPGRHLVEWTSPADSNVDVVDAWPKDPRYLVSVAQVRDRLRTRENKAGDKFESLPLYIAAASAVVESLVGPQFTSEETVTLVSPNGQRAVTLPHINIAVAAVAVDGSNLDVGAYSVDEDAGIVWVDIGKQSKVQIDYTVGGSVVPVAAQMACLEIIAHSWQQTRQGVAAVDPTSSGTTLISMGYAIPNRALEWLQAIPKVTGLA